MSPSYRKSPEVSRRSRLSWQSLHRSRSAGNHRAPGCCWRACRSAHWRGWCVVCGQGCAHHGRWRVDEPKCLLSGMPLWALVTFSRGTAAANGLLDSAGQPWGVPGQRQMCSYSLYFYPLTPVICCCLCVLEPFRWPACPSAATFPPGIRAQPTSACFPDTVRFLYHSSDGPHPFCLPRDCVHQALPGSPVVKTPFNPWLGN